MTGKTSILSCAVSRVSFRIDLICRANSYITYDSALITSKKIEELLDYMEESLNVTLNNIDVLDVNSSVIDKAGEMFLYLFHCPEDFWTYGKAWTEFIRDTVETKPLRIILLHLNNFLIKYKTQQETDFNLYVGKDIADILLEFLRNKVWVF